MATARATSRVAGTEEVDGSCRGESAFCREDDPDKVTVSVGLHHGTTAPIGQNVNPSSTARPDSSAGRRRSRPEPARPGLSGKRRCLPDPFHRDAEVLFRPLPSCIRGCWDVQGNDDIASYRLLELERLPVVHLDFTVDRELERTGIGHYGAVEIEDAMESFCECAVAVVSAPPEYVGVCYQRLDAHPPHLAGCDQREVGVDHRQRVSGRSFVHPHPLTPGDVFVDDQT